MSEEEDDTCPLCRHAGPPERRSTSTSHLASTVHSADSTPDDSLPMICCDRCSEWYHAACILLGSEAVRAVVPSAIRAYLAGRDGGAWIDWTGWVGQWYCAPCVASANGHRSDSFGGALESTIDSKTFPPKQKQRSRASMGKRIDKRASSADLPNGANGNGEVKAKKSKVSHEDGAMGSNGTHKPSSRSSALTPEPVAGPSRTSPPVPPAAASAPAVTDSAPVGIAKPDIATQHKATTPAREGPTASRPKRQAAVNRPDYHAMHNHISTPTARWLDLIHHPEKYGTTISVGKFPRIPAPLLTRSWIESSPEDVGSSFPPHLPPTLFYGPTREPLIIKPEDGGFEAIGGRLPPRDLTVSDIARLVGPSRSIGVIDVATQSSVNWTLQQWADYIATKDQPGAEQKKAYNIISLEISGTELGRMVRPPSLVAEIDWVDNFWDFGPGGKAAAVEEQDALLRAESEKEGDDGKDGKDGKDGVKAKKVRAPWPKVQLYCLMGSKGSWTDWHCDFAASSVYYTILKGQKQFFFIRPTAKNLAAYAEWSGSYEMQQDVWLGSMCDEVRSVILRAGDTMIIPAGYIHSVYTPEDAIVFGGNFLHSYDIPTQLRLRQIEIDTKVPQMFRFPYLDKLCWYVAEKTCSLLRTIQSYRPRATSQRPPLPPRRVLHGLVVLADFLLQQVGIMENPEEEDKKRKLVYDRTPDVVKDPFSLALELKARAERALPAGEREEDGLEVVAGKKRRVNGTANGTGSKAKGVKERKRKTATPATPTPENGQGDAKPAIHQNGNGTEMCVD